MSKYIVSFIPEKYTCDGQALIDWAKCPVFRYCVKDRDTGAVLDNAAGEGYMEPYEALAACWYDSMSEAEKRSVRLQRARVRVWRRSHMPIVCRCDKLVRDSSLDAIMNRLDVEAMLNYVQARISECELPCDAGMFLMSYLPSVV